jgi:hypothetical protein
MPYFHFSQNNSGGSFDFSEEQGLTHHVVIEAKDSQDANVTAIMKGLYFDGCSQGMDCSCCGDRWSRVGEWGETNGDAEPMVYDQPVGAFSDSFGGWMPDGKEIAVHHADGRIEWFGVQKEKSKKRA